MRARNVVIAVALVVAGIGLGALARPLVSEAQQAASGGQEMEAGPAGMWILRGDRVYVCVQDPIMRGTTPGAPICGPSTSLQR